MIAPDLVRSVAPLFSLGGPEDNRPDFVGHAYRSQERALDVVRDVYAGTLALRDAGTKYLPRFPLETESGYRTRRSAAVLFNALKRTVGGLTGMVFRKDPQLGDDVPGVIAGGDGSSGHVENIDLAGRAWDIFARDVFEAAIRDGHTHVLVDMPTADASIRTLADERARRIRPYWIHVLKGDLLSFRTAMIDGRTVLTQIAYRESTTEARGTFGEQPVERIRVYRLEGGRVLFQVWRKQRSGLRGGSTFMIERSGFASIDEIPMVTVYANRTGFLTSDPPLLDLALENIDHFQTRSSRKNALGIASVPVPVFVGMTDSTTRLAVGADTGIKLPAGGDAKYLEPQGKALDASRQELQDIERRMAVLGLSMLMSETRQAETATSKRIDKSESDSALAVAARGLEDALEDALRLHAKWMGLPSGGSVQVNRDFTAEDMNPAAIRVLSDMVGEGQLSLDTLWDSLVAGEILPPAFDAELEHGRLGSVSRLAPFLQNGRTADDE